MTEPYTPSTSTIARQKWRGRQVMPDCTTEPEWLDWLDSSALYTRGRRVPFCHDCRPYFKAESIGLGLCSFPETYFEVTVNEDGEEELIGRLQDGPEDDELEPDYYEPAEEDALGVGGWGRGELQEVPGVLRPEYDSEVREQEHLGELRPAQPGGSPEDSEGTGGHCG